MLRIVQTTPAVTSKHTPATTGLANDRSIQAGNANATPTAGSVASPSFPTYAQALPSTLTIPTIRSRTRSR